MCWPPRRRWPSCASAPTREREKTLIEAAGEVGIQLGDDIEKWWAAKDAGDTEEMHGVEDGHVEDSSSRRGGRTGSDASSRKRRRIRSQVVESAKGDRSTMESLLKNPAQIKVFLDHARVDALQEVLNACYEKYYYNAASDKAHRLLELWLNRRPELIRAATKPIESR